MEELLFYGQILVETLMAILVSSCIYFYWSYDHNHPTGRSPPEKIQHNAVLEVPNIEVNAYGDTEATQSDQSEDRSPLLDHDSDDQTNRSTSFRPPPGVQLRQNRGRQSVLNKKVNAGLFSKSDSGYMSHAASREVLDVPHTDFASNATKEAIGTEGGCVAVGGCLLVIPKEALATEKRIRLECSFDKPMDDSSSMGISPTVELFPSGIKFRKPVTMVLPAYYDATSEDEPVNITIQSTQHGEDWETCTTVKNTVHGKVIFQVGHFTKFRAVVEKIYSRLLRKQLYYAGFIKRYALPETLDHQTLFWCVCDNLPHVVQQLTAEMSEHYERVVESETITIGYRQNIGVEHTPASDEGMQVAPKVHTFQSDDLWPPGMTRKMAFVIHRDQVSEGQITSLNFALRVKATASSSITQNREIMANFQWSRPLSSAPQHIHIIQDSYIGTLIVDNN